MGAMTLRLLGYLLGYVNVQGFPPSVVGWQAAEEAIAPLAPISTYPKFLSSCKRGIVQSLPFFPIAGEGLRGRSIYLISKEYI